MKTKMIIAVYIVVTLFSCGNGKQETNTTPNRVYFTIPAEDRKIMVPVQVSDSVTVNMCFDTGVSEGILLDSMIFVLHPSLIPENIPDTVKRGSAWAEWDMPALKYDTAFTIRVGDTDLNYSFVTSMNWKYHMANPKLDGTFGIPSKDSTHVWELNFERNYLEIHPADHFTMPEDCYLLPFVYNRYNYLVVQFPMKIQCADGDTLTVNRTFFIDTGMPWDIALMYRAEELAFFNAKEDAVWTGYLSSYYRHYNVKAILFDNFVMDSLRIYTFDYPNNVHINYLIGINFLKRFNVFFDMKNRRVGLQPIENFQRIVDPLAKRFHLSTKRTPDGKIIVAKIADNKSNYYKKAGFREGDEIVMVNGKLFKNITGEEMREFHERDTLVYDIIRNRQALEIVVKVDKNEEQGD
jgi:hypothetical protein